jgi:hypothetical protein
VKPRHREHGHPPALPHHSPGETSTQIFVHPKIVLTQGHLPAIPAFFGIVSGLCDAIVHLRLRLRQGFDA